MAFVKKTWKDRIVQYANRRLLTKSGGEVEQVIVTRDEGAVTEAGDKFDAATMNDLEDRLEYAFDNVSTAIECTQAEYDTWKNAGQLKPQTSYIITDAPNLNPTASDIEYSGAVTVKQAIDSKADITALPSVKYEELNVTLDNSGEGTLYFSNKYVVGIKDLTSDGLYVGYIVYYASSQTKCKAFSRSALAFTSQGIVSMTRKIGVYYLDNISTT